MASSNAQTAAIKNLSQQLQGLGRGMFGVAGTKGFSSFNATNNLNVNIINLNTSIIELTKILRTTGTSRPGPAPAQPTRINTPSDTKTKDYEAKGKLERFGRKLPDPRAFFNLEVDLIKKVLHPFTRFTDQSEKGIFRKMISKLDVLGKIKEGFGRLLGNKPNNPPPAGNITLTNINDLMIIQHGEIVTHLTDIQNTLKTIASNTKSSGGGGGGDDSWSWWKIAAASGAVVSAFAALTDPDGVIEGFKKQVMLLKNAFEFLLSPVMAVAKALGSMAGNSAKQEDVKSDAAARAGETAAAWGIKKAGKTILSRIGEAGIKAAEAGKAAKGYLTVGERAIGAAGQGSKFLGRLAPGASIALGGYFAAEDFAKGDTVGGSLNALSAGAEALAIPFAASVIGTPIAAALEATSKGIGLLAAGWDIVGAHEYMNPPQMSSPQPIGIPASDALSRGAAAAPVIVNNVDNSTNKGAVTSISQAGQSSANRSYAGLKAENYERHAFGLRYSQEGLN